MMQQLQPNDTHNTTLLGHVHPADWVNPEPAPRYNLVVIGAGTAGLVTAAGAAGLGAKVALVERELMGGDCLNVGCVPSKALLRAARAYADVRDAGQFGVVVPDGTQVDFPAVMERMRRLRAHMSAKDSATRFQGLGVDVFLGEGRFVDSQTVAVGEQRLRFRRAVIATGARATSLPIPGLAEAGYLTNETVFSLTSLPRRLAVIGAGPIGCELAQAFARFGSQVSLLEVAPQILIREDRDAAERIQAALVKDRVDTLVGCNIRPHQYRRRRGKSFTLSTRGLRPTSGLMTFCWGSGGRQTWKGLELGARRRVVRYQGGGCRSMTTCGPPTPVSIRPGILARSTSSPTWPTRWPGW